MNDLTKILNNPEEHYPGNFDTPQRANALLTRRHGLWREPRTTYSNRWERTHERSTANPVVAGLWRGVWLDSGLDAVGREAQMNWEKVQAIILYILLTASLVGLVFMFTMLWIAI